MTDLQSIVLPLQLSTQLLQFVFQGVRFALLGSREVLLLLQHVASFLVLDVISFESLHISQMLSHPFLQDLNLLHIIHARGVVVEFAICFLDFSFYNNTTN